MRYAWTRSVLRLTFPILISAAGPAWAAPLSGQWGGDRLLAVFSADGATLTSDCASGSIKGRVEPDAAGAFKARGVFRQDTPGPQRADEAPSAPGARFTGRVAGTVMTLSIRGVGEAAPHSYTLHQGVRPKLVRCY